MTALLAAGLTREQARDAARDELSRREYQDAQPPLLLRAVGRVVEALGDLLDAASFSVGDGFPARLLLVGLLVAVVALVLARLGPSGAGRRGRAVFDGGQVRTAAQHREAAERHAGQGAWAEAVRERLRAVVRELEDRGVLDARPGRTAGEVARDAGQAAPVLADPLRQAAGVFDEVWYGGRTADRQSYDVLVGVDGQVRETSTARPA